MSWRERLAVKRSKAEDLIQGDLQREKLSKGYTTNRGIKFTEKEREEYGVYGTEVDGAWFRLNIVTFYDGEPVHKKGRQSERDRAVDKVSRARSHS